MNPDQFDVVIHLLRMTSPQIVSAARRVLIDGERQADAARAEGCFPNHLARAVVRIREADAAIRSAYVG